MSNSTTGFLLQTMLYVANITKHDLNNPTREEFLLSPMGADSGKQCNDSRLHFTDTFRQLSVK